MKKVSWLFLLVCFVYGPSINLLRAEKYEILDKNPVFSPDGKKITFLSNRDFITVYNDHGEDYNYGFRHLFELYTIDTDGNNLKKISGLSDIFYFVDCFCWSPDGEEIAYSASKLEILKNTEERKHLGSGIFVINSDGSNLRNFIYDKIADEISWSPDGKKIAVAKIYDGEIRIINHDVDYKLTEGANPVWSPDSKQIAFKIRTLGGADFYTINIENKNKKEYELVNSFKSAKNRSNQDMSFRGADKVYWSPDGSKIYAQAHRSIVVKEINKANEYWRIVMNSPDENPDPRWESYANGKISDSVLSPDGKEIVLLLYNDIYKSSSTPGPVIKRGYKIQSKPVNLRNLTKTPQITEEKPLWSPDGKQIVFVINGEIWIMNSDGSNQTPLTNKENVAKKTAQK